MPAQVEMNVTNILSFQTKKLMDTQIQTTALNQFVASSIRVILEEEFMHLATSLIIVLSSRSNTVFNLFLNVLQHLFDGVDNVNVQLVIVDHQKPQRIDGPRSYNLLLIDSYESFLDIDVASYTKNYNFNEYYHIFLMQYDRYIPDHMQNIFNYCWNNNIINCNVEFQNVKGELHMYTFFPYGPGACDNTSPQHINEFVGDKWLHKPYFLQKLKNFYGCRLVGALRLSPPYTYMTSNNDGTFKGMEVALVEAIANFLNFSLVLKVISQDDRALPTSGGGFNMLNDRSAHFAFGYYRKRASTMDFYTTTADYCQTPVVGAIYAKSHMISSVEVLVFPFRIETWYAIVVCFVFTMAVTKCVRWRHPGAMKTFSIVASGFGLPVGDATNRLESTLIYIPWLWSAFLVRCVYSGLLYILFSSDIFHAMPSSIYKAINASYQSVMLAFTFNDLQGIEYYNVLNKNQKTVLLNTTNEMAALEYLEEHYEENILAVVAEDFLKYYMKTNYKVGHFYTMPEIVVQQQLCIYLAKHSFLINQFEWTLKNLKAMGLLQHLSKNHLNSKTLVDFRTKEEDEMIIQNDLHGIYLTCSIMYAAALIVFALEMLSMKAQCLRKCFE